MKKTGMIKKFALIGVIGILFVVVLFLTLGQQSATSASAFTGNAPITTDAERVTLLYETNTFRVKRYGNGNAVFNSTARTFEYDMSTRISSRSVMPSPQITVPQKRR